MYRNHLHRILWVLLIIFIAFFCSQNQVIWLDLAEQIALKTQTYYNQNFSDEYFSTVYSSKFSKDPFGDAMSSVEGMSKQLQMAWVQYVEQVLKEKWCYMSQKKILGILYAYVPEFRVEITRSLKQEIWDYDINKYKFDEATLNKYCSEFYECENSEWNFKRLRRISASSSADVKTHCKEFFTKNYKDGENNKEILQKIEVAQIWADKYWNNTTDDSPYDIMHDLEILAKVLYYGVEGPITPVLYKIPTFSNSAKNLVSKKNGNKWSNYNSSDWWRKELNSKRNDDIVDNGWLLEPNGWWGWVSLVWWNMLDKDIKLEEDWWYSNDVKALPFVYEKNWWFDDLVEWLNPLMLQDNDAELYSSLCKEQDDWEVEQEDLGKENKEIVWDVPNFSDLSDEEYQEVIDYMLGAVDDYLVLPEDKEEEIQQNVWNINNMIDATTPSDLEKTAEQIKNCWKSCEWLRIDQKASCMLKCACWEIKSPVFNPEKTPWLWPIFLIRFCAVPAVNTNFSIGWKRISSIEEWLNEIYWVVDKLSREWRLWKWTQQYEFLDSSTKKINIADTLAFSIDVEFVDVMNKTSKHSDQYWKKILENFNKEALMVYGISNPLDDSLARNVYRIVWDWWDERGLRPMVDLIEDSKANRYSMVEESFSNWMDQQANLRKKMSEDFSDWTEYANTLKMKKS